MKVQFKKLIVGLLSIFVVGFAAQAGEAPGYGSIVVTKLLVMPDVSGHVDWIDAISGAQGSVHMTMYHLTDKAVIGAIIEKAKNKNVDIRILVDGKSLVGGYALAIKSMTDAGVQVKGGSSAFSLTHSKDMVIDGKVAFVGAVDLTNTSTRMRDFAIITPDAGIISEMENVFEVDWKNTVGNTNNTPPVSNPNLVWSPVNSAAKLVALLDSARTSVVLQSENFNNTDIINALNRATARGVSVRMVLPECSFGNAELNYQGISTLIGAVVHMQHDESSVEQPYIHSKMIVVDQNVVYLGSINMSFNSILNDREVGVIFSDAKTAGTLTSEFEKDWNRSQPPSATHNCPKLTF